MSHIHALIIDDNPNNTAILAEMLSMEGIQTTTIADPTRLAVMLLDLPETHLVFLDLEMPKLNGYEVFNQLRAVEAFEQVPIIAYTVHVSEAQTVRKLGFHSFLAKPLDLDRFPQQLARILNGEHIWT